MKNMILKKIKKQEGNLMKIKQFKKKIDYIEIK